MIEAKAIYSAVCDDCGGHKMLLNIQTIDIALAALIQKGWKVGYDGSLLETICPDCAKKRHANV